MIISLLARMFIPGILIAATVYAVWYFAAHPFLGGF
jgi:hypothetical protein